MFDVGAGQRGLIPVLHRAVGVGLGDCKAKLWSVGQRDCHPEQSELAGRYAYAECGGPQVTERIVSWVGSRSSRAVQPDISSVLAEVTAGRATLTCVVSACVSGFVGTRKVSTASAPRTALSALTWTSPCPPRAGDEGGGDHGHRSRDGGHEAVPTVMV